MAKFGWDERELFNVETLGVEDLSGVPANPPAGQYKIYSRSGVLYKLDSAGTETPIDTNTGESNTASNVNAAGVGVFKQKTGVDLEFRGINAGSNKITVTLDAGNNEIDIDVNESNFAIDHGDLSGLGDDDHSQYFLLAGRSGGQIGHGGTDASDDLELRSTSNVTKGVVKIIDGSEFQHSDRHMLQSELQTTDGTESTCGSVALADDKVYNVIARVVARRSDGGGEARASWQFQTTAYRAGGGAVLQGSVKQEYKSSSTGQLSADIDVDTNDVRIRVTGVAAQDFEWKCYVDYIESD